MNLLIFYINTLTFLAKSTFSCLEFSFCHPVCASYPADPKLPPNPGCNAPEYIHYMCIVVMLHDTCYASDCRVHYLYFCWGVLVSFRWHRVSDGYFMLLLRYFSACRTEYYYVFWHSVTVPCCFNMIPRLLPKMFCNTFDTSVKINTICLQLFLSSTLYCSAAGQYVFSRKCKSSSKWRRMVIRVFK